MPLYVVTKSPCCECGFIRDISTRVSRGISDFLFPKQNSAPYLQHLCKTPSSHLDYSYKKFLTHLPVFTLSPLHCVSYTAAWVTQWNGSDVVAALIKLPNASSCSMKPHVSRGFCDLACCYFLTMLPTVLVALLQLLWPPRCRRRAASASWCLPWLLFCLNAVRRHLYN